MRRLLLVLVLGGCSKPTSGPIVDDFECWRHWDVELGGVTDLSARPVGRSAYVELTFTPPELEDPYSRCWYGIGYIVEARSLFLSEDGHGVAGDLVGRRLREDGHEVEVGRLGDATQEILQELASSGLR